MQKILLPFFIVLAITHNLIAQFATIPDANFRAALKELVPNAFNANEQLNVTDITVRSLTMIDVSNRNISNLEGIQYFIELNYFDCSKNQITSLPALPVKLENLRCGSNLLTALPALPSTLRILSCLQNNLVSIPALPSQLRSLYVSDNLLTSLPAIPASVTSLSFSNNKVTTMPALPTGLTSLDCNKNGLTVMPSLPPSLKLLNCLENKFSSLPELPSTLTSLNCSDNNLKALPALPSTLTSLNFSNNYLKTMPAIPSGVAYCVASMNCFTTPPVNPNPGTMSFFWYPNNPECPEYITIPDANFKAALKELIPSCFNAADQLNINCNGVTSLKTLKVIGKNIRSLWGVQYFKGLEVLECTDNQIDTLPWDIRRLTNLKELYCIKNKIFIIENLPLSLVKINCSYNSLYSLNLYDYPNITHLTCTDNSIKSISLPKNVKEVNCSMNQITGTLNVPASTETLYCVYNKIEALSGMEGLKVLYSSFNQLTSLPALPEGMTILSVYYNKITSLPTLPASLTNLQCLSNRLTSLPALPAGLTQLECGINNISSLPELPAGLTQLSCHVNNLVSLPALPNTLKGLVCHNNFLKALPALPASLTSYDGAHNCYETPPVNPYPNTLSKFNVTPNRIDCVVTGILQGEKEEYEFLVYPNPASGKVTLEANGEIWKLYDTNGTIQMEQSVTGKTELDLQSIKPGMYFYSLGEKRGKFYIQ